VKLHKCSFNCLAWANLEKIIILDSAQQVDDQVKGLCLYPKFGLDLMKCEIDRLILLTRNSIYPVPYFVPRRVINFCL
jgi:hypothetical protein